MGTCHEKASRVDRWQSGLLAKLPYLVLRDRGNHYPDRCSTNRRLIMDWKQWIEQNPERVTDHRTSAKSEKVSTHRKHEKSTPEARQPQNTRNGCDLSLTILALEASGLPKPVLEHKFHPERRWRFDLAWIDAKVALEIEGGVWIQGRHNRGKGFIADIEKYNAATALGWTLFRCIPEWLPGIKSISFDGTLLDHLHETITAKLRNKQ